jgi:hypothetical protein
MASKHRGPARVEMFPEIDEGGFHYTKRTQDKEEEPG